MKTNRSISPNVKLIFLLLVNVFGGMLFMVIFSYFVWGSAYDIVASAVGLVAIGAFATVGIGAEIYYINYWFRVPSKHLRSTVEHEIMCDCGNFVEKRKWYV